MSTQRMIVPLGKNAGYLEARTLAKERGGKLPSNVLHDEYLVRSDKWRAISSYYAAWAREVLVYPEKGGRFKEGKDIVDSQTGWILPASYVPKEAVGRKGVGLFVDPEDVKEENGKVIVHPAGSVIVLSPFIQESGNAGKVDESTRIPLALEADSDIDKRWLWRIDGVGVRPLVRIDDYLGYDCRRNVIAGGRPHLVRGVALEAEAPIGGAEKIVAAPLQKENGVLLSGVTRAKLDALIKDAEASMYELVGYGFPLDDTLKGAGIKRLLDTLKNKE